MTADGMDGKTPREDAYQQLVSSPDPIHKMGKDLVTLLAFLGCAESAKSTCANTFSYIEMSYEC